MIELKETTFLPLLFLTSTTPTKLFPLRSTSSVSITFRPLSRSLLNIAIGCCVAYAQSKLLAVLCLKRTVFYLLRAAPSREPEPHQ